MRYLVVFEEAAGPEATLCRTMEDAVACIQATREEVGETDEGMVDCVRVYAVTDIFKYQPPVGSAGLVKEKSL